MNELPTSCHGQKYVFNLVNLTGPEFYAIFCVDEITSTIQEKIPPKIIKTSKNKDNTSLTRQGE